MFSVIIPYYKKRKYIERCLDSVLNQTFKDFEIILVDDGSDDDIEQLLGQKFPEVNLYKQKNQGVSSARNKAIAHASHDYIAFLDGDDCWNPLYLEFASQVINSNKDTKIVGSGFIFNFEVSKQELVLKYRKIENYFSTSHIRNLIFLTSATIINKQFFVNNKGFFENFNSEEDIDVWFRVMISDGSAFEILNKMVYYSQEDDNQLTRQPKSLDKSLLSCFFQTYQPLFNRYQDKKFEKFVNFFVLFKLIHYYNKNDINKAKLVFEKRTMKLFFASLPYYVPDFLLLKKWYRQLALKYFKFLIKIGY